MRRGSTFFASGGSTLIFGLVFVVVALVSFMFMLVFTVQAESQETGIPPGTAAPGSNPDTPSAPPTLVTISAQGCTVSDGAAVTLEDGDGTTARFVDGQRGIEITAPDNQSVTIEGPTGDFIADHAVEKSDPGFDTDGDYTVVTSTGITCANTDSGDTNNDDDTNGDSNRDAASAGAVNLTCEQLIELVEDGAAAGQYITEISQRCEGSANVITETIPGKSLADTGGPVPGLLVAGLLLTGAGLFLRASLRR